MGMFDAGAAHMQFCLRNDSRQGARRGVNPHPPDDQSSDEDACILWIRRQGWMGKIEKWMIAWVAEGRTPCVR